MLWKNDLAMALGAIAAFTMIDGHLAYEE